MEDNQINKVFKQVFKAFLIEVMKDSKLAEMVGQCDTYKELGETLKEESEHVFLKTLGGECSDCESMGREIEDLEDSITDLNNDTEDNQKDFDNEIGEIEFKLSKSLHPETLDDFYKIEAFKTAMNKFSVSEIESLLE